MLDANLYEEELHPTPLGATWREFKQRHVAVFGLVILTVFIVVAIAGPLLSPYAPTTQHTNALLIPPAWNDNGSILHILGTDALGRDMLTRLFYGTQVTLFSSIATVFIALSLGVAMGVVAGMSKGLRSSFINHVLDILMLTPTLLIAIIIVAILGTGLTNAMLAIGLALVPRFVHMTRDFVREEMNKDYIKTARLDGANLTQVFLFNILPNMVELLIVQGTLAISVAILDISALGFLNLGAQTLMPELGVMIADGLSTVYIAPWNILLPGLSIFLMVLSINIVGDGLRSALRNRLTH
ncbi:MAG: ABC transporter permease subunit [Glaciecola sp.]|jgi:cationic peptide transport system permease protein|nr:ABC transporter permease subunit [Glaciecola sp.]MDG1816954.1 ABC transporter permease subunit [Glaciecola sp.]MDG2099701.1 ABC transporter permease subunit [Glaciecola sp.]